MCLYKFREWVGTVTGKGDRWEGDRLGRSEPPSECQHHRTPSTYLHCTARGRPTSSAGCCFAERPANCWLFVLRGLCRADHLPAVFACSGLVLRALFACLLAFAMPCPLPFSSVAPFILLCPPPCSFHVCRNPRKASVCKLQELSRWQQQRWSAVAARAPHCIHPPFPVLQGLPCRQPHQGTAFVQPMRRCSLRH